MQVCPAGAVFLKAHDTSGAAKDAEHMAAYLMEAIELAGPGNVVQVVTDSAANCKAAGTIIMRK
jgi:Protein of unknown function (DUF 659)